MFQGIQANPTNNIHIFFEIEPLLCQVKCIQKQPLGGVLWKRCSEVCLCLGFWGVLDSTISAEKNSCSVEGGGTLAKLGVLLKMCHTGKIRYSGKDLIIYLKYWGFPLWCICLLPGKMMGFFFILIKLTGRYLQWPGKSRCSVK